MYQISRQRIWLSNKRIVKDNKEKCLEKSKQYYKENKERLQKTAGQRYQRLSEGEEN